MHLDDEELILHYYGELNAGGEARVQQRRYR